MVAIRNKLGIVFLFLSFLVQTPFVYADGIPAAGSASNKFIVCGENNPNDCTFGKIYTLIKNIIDFLLIDVMVPAAIISIMFAGFKYVMARGNPGEIKKAHDIFYYIVVGIVLALAAWLIVNTILIVLSGEGSQYNFLKQR